MKDAIADEDGWCCDLLGDPIPPNFGRRGRPQHVPTLRNRQKVMLQLAIGWPDGRIANALAISVPTLRKHYFRELRARDEARDRLDAALVQRCYEQVEKGNVGAMKELGRMLERAAMLGIDFTGRARKAAAEPKLGKKEAAALAAHNPDRGSTLGQLIAQRQEGPPN